MNFLLRYKVALFAFIFVFTAGYAFYFRITPLVDAKAYNRIAHNLVEHGVFKEDVSAPYGKDLSIQRAGPGYEFFLAGMYRIFGFRYESVWITQALIHTLTAFLLFCIAKRIFSQNGERTGMVAAILFGFHPDLIEISAMLMTETLFLFCVTSIIYLFIRVYDNIDSWLWGAGLGSVVAIAALIRPTVIFFIPIIMWMFIAKKKYARLCAMLAVCAVLLLPWTIRNYQVYHQLIPTTLIGQYNLWVGNTMTADGGQLGGGVNPFEEYVNTHDYYSVGPAAKQAFTQFVTEHPGSFVRLTLIRIVRYASLLRPMGFWFYLSGTPQTIFVTLSGLAIAGLFITSAAGMVHLWRQKNTLYRYLILLALTSPLPLLITVVQSRYRFPIYPFLTLFGAWFIVYALSTRGWWKQKEWLYPVCLLLLISAIDLSLSLDIILTRIRTLL